MKDYQINVLTNAHEALKLFDTITKLLSPTEIMAPSLQPYWLRAFLRNYGQSRNLAVTVVIERAQLTLEYYLPLPP